KSLGSVQSNRLQLVTCAPMHHYYVSKSAKLRRAVDFSKKNRYDSNMTRLTLALVALVACQSLAAALEPGDVVLLVNRNMPESAEVAEHYRQKRQIPRENIVSLDLPTGEDMSRRDYDTKVVVPLRAALKQRKDKIRVLLCIYGVPLRVGPADL